MRRLRFLTLVLAAAGCGRGLVGRTPATGEPEDAAAERGAADARPLDARSGDAPAPDAAGADAPAADAAAPDAPADAAVDRAVDARVLPDAPLLPASTVWRPCGKLARAWPQRLAHAPDGRDLLIGAGDSTIFLSSVTGTTDPWSDGTQGAPTQVAFAPDGTFFGQAGDGRVAVWRRQDKSWASDSSAIVEARTLAFSPGTARLVLMAGDRQEGTDNVKLWRIVSGPELTLEPQPSWNGSPDVTFAADGASLLALDEPGVLAHLDLAGHQQDTTRLAAPIRQPVFSPDRTLIAGLTTASGALAVLRTDTGAQVWQVPPGASAPEQIFFLGAGPGLVTVRGSEVVVHRMSDPGPPAPLVASAPLIAAQPSPDGTSLAGITEEGAVIRMSLTSGQPLSRPRLIAPNVEQYFPALAASGDGRYLAGYGTALWDLRTRAVVRILPPARQLAFSPDGELIALADSGCTINRLSDLGKSFAPCQRNPAFAPDGARAAGADQHEIRVFNRSGVGERILKSTAIDPGVAFSPDGAWLAGSGRDLWSTADWSPRWHLTPDAGPLDDFPRNTENGAAFSPDGRQVLVSTAVQSDDGVMPIWVTHTLLLDVRDGHVVHDFGGTVPRRPSFSPDGNWLVAGGQLWYLPTFAPHTLASEVEISLFLPDGRIAAGDKKALVTLYCPRD